MKPGVIMIGAAALVGVAVTGWLVTAGGPDNSGLLRDDRATLALGAQVYAANCASCHGANLQGAPNWRERNADGRLPAPPHDRTGHTWHHDSEALFRITKYGVAAIIGDPGYATDMPIYDGVLSDDEIAAVLSYIRSTWPKDIRQAYDARETGG